MKRVYLDMDGCIADLYNIQNWLERLHKEDENIFLECKPMISEEQLIKSFPKDEFDITVLTMTPLGASIEYHNNVIEQKEKWLDKYFPSIKKRIYLKYGNNKNLKNSKNAILIDDSEIIRKNWNGLALNPAEVWG